MNDMKIAQSLLRLAKEFVGARLRLNPQYVREAIGEVIEDLDTEVSAEVTVNISGSYTPATYDDPADYPEMDGIDFDGWGDVDISPRRLPLRKFLRDVAERTTTGVKMTPEEIANTKVFQKLVKKILAKGVIRENVEDIDVEVSGAEVKNGGYVSMTDAFIVYGKISGSSVSLTMKPTAGAEKELIEYAHDFDFEPLPRDYGREPDEPSWDDDGEVGW